MVVNKESSDLAPKPSRHIPVLLKESIDLLNIRAGHTYVDATAGGGGHLAEICRRAGLHSRIIAIDQDASALERLKSMPVYSEVSFIHANFGQLRPILSGLNINTIDGGVIADIGISSSQLDDGARGFSFQTDGPLDMRMDLDNPVTAEYLVNTLAETELANIIYKYGEERHSRAIARAIVKNRPVSRTKQLAFLVEACVRSRGAREKIHPATRTFQALRIAVNNELENLEIFLEDTIELLAPGGRLAVITFHSLEDRLVKHFFNHMASACICPPRQPICTCNKKAKVKVLTTKPICADEEELVANIRSRSAKLRAVEKLP